MQSANAPYVQPNKSLKLHFFKTTICFSTLEKSKYTKAKSTNNSTIENGAPIKPITKKPLTERKQLNQK